MEKLEYLGGVKKRLGMIVRYDNSGLGTLSWEFARHLKPDKVLMVQNGVFQTFPERYDSIPEKRMVMRSFDRRDVEWLFQGIDVLLAIETFYDWYLIKEARKRNVKTVLYTMFEMTPDPIPLHPDLYLCPSTLDYKVMPNPKVYLPVPLATDRLLWQKREKAHTFIHSASHGGISGRKGTQLFLDAIPMVKSDVKFKIFSWNEGYKIPRDSRVEFVRTQFKNYWQLWREGDVLVYPQDYNGICLPVVEAMACGLGVVTTDIYPFNEYMPKELLFPIIGTKKTRASNGLMEVDAAIIAPADIAKKIDEIANTDISKYSLYGKKYAEEHSWDALLKKYERVFDNL